MVVSLNSRLESNEEEEKENLQLLEVGRAEALRFVHVARKVSACQPTIAQDVCRTTLASQQLLSEPHALVLGLDQTRLGEGAYRRERERERERARARAREREYVCVCARERE